MVNLTFGEQVKIILSRKGMTIKQLAELMEQHTGKPMSRQNMTQRLGRDNFQEQDMRVIAEILGCKFQLSIMEGQETELTNSEGLNTTGVEVDEVDNSLSREITMGELTDMLEEESEVEVQETAVEGASEVAGPQETRTPSAVEPTESELQERELLKKGVKGFFSKKDGLEAQRPEAEKKPASEESKIVGDINPYTGKEYKSNSVRMHPKRIGYVQVYDQEQHKWTDMTEWAFLGYQERKKALLGKDYEPPIYLD